MDFVRRFAWKLSPVTFAFVASAVLSILAIATGNLNRDGMLYVEAARAFMNGGLSAAVSVFGWPFLSILMGVLAKLTGLPPDWCGHFLNILFMGGACALLVAIIRRNDPQLAWLAAVVVLTLPGLNDYRNELIREYGCWFFMLLAFWLARGWPEKPDWPRSFAIQIALLLAALFRPEALVFYPCIVLWQHFQTAPEQRWKASIMLGTLPAIGLFALLLAYFSGALGESSRLAYEINRFNFFAEFDRTATAMSQAFNRYAREDAESAHVILFFGSLAVIPWKFIGKLGIFLIPFLIFVAAPGRFERCRRHSLLLWALGGYLLILSIFVLQQQFVSGRYIGLLLIFTTPFVAYGLHDLLQRFPRSKLPLFALCAVIALANVVSLKPGKMHFAQAGQWLASEYEDGPRVYLESARTAHYAGWKFSSRPKPVHRDRLLDRIRNADYDLVVLEVSRKEPDISDWIATAGLLEIRRFVDRNGDAIVICVPATQPRPATDANTASKRANTTSTE
jgi:hypothetical protein